MKKTIKTLWHGIKAVFTAVVDWVATLFGMNDNSKYGRVMRRIVGTAFAVMVFFWAATGIMEFCDEIGIETCSLFDKDDDVFLSETLSDNLFFYDGFYGVDGYMANADGKKLIKPVHWISKPLEGDSLVCYSDGEYRGYFHMSDGKIVIKPIYTHAWIFSEGLAAVEQSGRIKFIDKTGNVVIDKDFAYNPNDGGYVFHKGRCVVNDQDNKHKGLIDRNGNWVVPPIYESIMPIDTFWLFATQDEQTLLTFDMDTIMPPANGSYEIRDTAIFVTYADHSMSCYTRQGDIIAANQIMDVELLMYDNRKVEYPSHNSDDEEYVSYDNPYILKSVATCMRYEGESGWYGLMSPDGRQITPPLYYSVEAVDKDLYLCKTTYDRGVLLNSKGHKVEELSVRM